MKRKTRYGAGDYEIVVEGELESRWSSYFDGLRILAAEGRTLMAGHFDDQSRLHGALGKIRDLNVVLLSVHRVE